MTDEPLCEDLFDRLASEDPDRLVALLGTEMDPCDLTFAAATAGERIQGHGVAEALLRLLSHPDRIVREGALYGIAHHPSPAAVTRITEMAEHDESPSVNAVARETLEFWTPEFTR